MSAEREYLAAEAKNIRKALEMIRDLLSRPTLTPYEVIALGKLLQDAYTGIERILRTLLEGKGLKVQKSETWHKDLLLAARQHSLISEDQFTTFRDLLLFRHMQVHGYGFMLNEARLRELAKSVPGSLERLLQDLLE